MTTGRIALPKKPSNSHWDHVAYSETDPHATGVMPPEYTELARKLIVSKAGNDAAELMAMLGITEGIDT